MKKSKLSIFMNGFIYENPAFVIFLGMCPVLGTTTSVENGVYMSLCVLFVLLLSNIVISALRKIIPDEIRLPVYIILIATLVSVVDMLFHAYLDYGIYQSLGSFISLIVVNCIILGRAEEFANKNTVVDSIFDALGYAAGFALALLSVSFFREVLGTGKLSWADNSVTIIPEDYAIKLFQRPAGAFIVLGCIVALYSVILRSINEKKEKNAAKKAAQEKAVSTAEVK